MSIETEIAALAAAATNLTTEVNQALDTTLGEVNAMGGAKLFKTWAQLSAHTGMVNGDSALVLNDSGTHTDPIGGGSVSNSGIYRYSTAWERIADLESHRAALEADRAEQSAVYAGGFEAPEYASQSAGNAATTLGQVFRVPKGTSPQTFDWYRKLTSGSELVDPLATNTELAGSNGASLIGKQAPYYGAQNEIVFQILQRLPLTPEQFGAVADFDFATWSGTNNTTALQNMINAASQEGRNILIPFGKKYLTRRLRLYNDSALNPDYALRAGRFSIRGEASGHATGAIEGPGSAIVHMDGYAEPLIDVLGAFSEENPSGMGGYFDIGSVNLLGGNQTTAVVYLEACAGSIKMEQMTVRVRNSSGIGIDENTTWETVLTNILIRGGATGLGPNQAGYNPATRWSAIGHNVRENGSGGQVNMKVYTNVDCYRMGYGTRVGRRGSNGTFGPLVWLGGQDALSDYHGFWVDGGVYALSVIGRQIEQSRLAGLRIDSDGASDIEHNIKWQGGYFTHCGKIEDGSPDSYAIRINDGINVEIDGPVFQNTRSGIYFDRTTTKNLMIRRPELRTVSSWGSANGTFIGSSNGNIPTGMNIKLESPRVVNGTATLVSEDARQAFAIGATGEIKSVSDNNATPSLSMGFELANHSAGILNLNNNMATTITDITGSYAYHTVTLMFSNTNTKIASNGNIYLTDGIDFVPLNSRATLTLKRNSGNTAWYEVGRSNAANGERVIGMSALASSITGTVTETTLASIDIPAGILGVDGRVEVDMLVSMTNSANNKIVRAKLGGSTFATHTLTTVASGRFRNAFANRGTANSQIAASGANQGSGTNASAVVTMTVDTSVGQQITITGQLSSTGETITLESYVVRAITGKSS